MLEVITKSLFCREEKFHQGPVQGQTKLPNLPKDNLLRGGGQGHQGEGQGHPGGGQGRPPKTQGHRKVEAEDVQEVDLQRRKMCQKSNHIFIFQMLLR